MSDPGQGRAAACVAALLGALSIAAVGPAFVNHDAAWYLYVVQRWLHGATLYRDVIDTNPPLIIWLTAIPATAAAAARAGAPAVFKLFVFLAAGLSLLSVGRIVRREWPDREFVLIGTAAFACLPFVKSDFGQREHLALLLTLPYVFAAAGTQTRSASWARWTTGVAGGLGFCIKPHFLLAWIAVEIAVALSRGVRAIRRTEAIAVVLTTLAYGVAVVVVTPEYLSVADQVRRVYGGLNSPMSVLLRVRELQVWVLALALLAAVRWPRREPLVAVLFAAATGYLAAAMLQLKGWSYHLYPSRALLVVTLAAEIATILAFVPGVTAMLRGGRRGLAAVFAAVLTVASIRYVAEARHPAAPDLVSPFVKAIARDGAAGPFAVLSMRTIIYPAFPAVNYAHASWSLRHNSLWFLQGFYDDQDLHAGPPFQAHPLDAMPPLERHFFGQIVDDLCASPPALLAVERPAPVAPAGRRALDLEAYYAQSPRAARLLHAYTAAGTIGPFTLLTPGTAPSCE